MTNEQRIAFLKNMASGIFVGKQSMPIEQWAQCQVPLAWASIITMWQPRGFVNNTIRGIDVDLNIGDRIIQLRLMEQNPNKVDHMGNLKTYANLARQGHKIMWVINRNGGFLGRIQDGIWHASQDRATSPAQPAYNYNTPEHELNLDAAYNHIDEDINDSSFSGIPGTSQPNEQNNSPAPQDRMTNDEIPDVDIGIPEYVLRYYSEMEGPDE